MSETLNFGKRWVRDGVKQWLIPEFERLGFVTTPVSSDLKRDYPFGTLRRSRGGLVDIVEIDFFHPRGDPAFRIFLASLPAGPWTYGGQIFRNEDVLTGWLPESYQMPRDLRWFRVKRWPWSPLPTQADYERLAKRVARMVPEAEAAFTSGKVGPHIRYVKMHP